MLRTGIDAATASRFQLLETLGSGGFGTVHEAIDLRTQQRVALKLLGNTSGTSIARFKNEFRALADCHHPNLVGLKELIEHEGQWLIVMEFVPGCDLRDYLRDEAEAAPSGELTRARERRLRAAMIDVAEGLRALHGFGILHRDLKPSNVRVRPDGRAVLLDFGLAATAEQLRESAEAMVGTVRYMAPEQAAGESVGSAADVYALGVCLFEALTGRVPFDGDHALAILAQKRDRSAPLASSLHREVPADLDALCARMLATLPAERPTLDEVLALLAGAQRAEERVSSAPSPLAREVFTGREEELAQLERALLRTQRGELRIVLIEGESGVGKSELVAEFLERASARHEHLSALRGRCYENEQVSYKAFDGCIDELAKLLERLPVNESAALLPLRAHLLAQLFPVLRNLRAIAKAPRETTTADLSARRIEAFAALAALLAKLAEAQPLVLVVDDLQWADAESFRLLHALVHDSAQPPPLLLIATIRPSDELAPAVLDQVKQLRGYPATEAIQLYGLPLPQARALAARLLAMTGDEPWLDALARESHGHPLFLRELVAYSRAQAPGEQRALSLDAALRARIERLEARPRALLELVVSAARPHGRHVFARALGLAEVEEPARELLATKLLRVRSSQELGCYHDRIRRAVSELIPAERAAALHRQLASALAEDDAADPVEQARHWDLAGERERAVEYYQRAIARALETLAFTRAAQLCARSLELLGDEDPELAQRLAVQRAHALACLGHSAEAAAIYERAAEHAEGEARIRLRSRSAQQLMLSGNIGRGFAAARALLGELGVRVPIGTTRALLGVVWDRLCLAISSLRSGAAGDARVESKRRIVIDVIDELVHGVWLAHPMTMLSLSSQQLRLSAGTTSPERRALAIATHGWLLSVSGSYPRALPLLEQSRAKLKGSRDGQSLALQAYTEGSARIAGFDWAGGSSCMQEAQQLALEHCPDWPWLVTNVRYHLGAAWYQLGEHRRLAREMNGWISEARERNNALAIALLTGMGHGFTRHLIADDPEAALYEREQALAAISSQPVSFVHFGHFMGKCMSLAYQGGPSALRFMESFAAEHRRAPLFGTRMVRDVVLSYLQGAHLHAAVGVSAAERKARLRSARATAKRLARSSPVLRAYATLALAQVDAVEGQLERALAGARSARTQFDALGDFTRNVALFLEGLLEGGNGGREKQSDGLSAYELRGWRAPLAALRMNLPVLPLLLASHHAQRAPDAPLLLGRYELLDARDGASHERLARDVHTGRTLELCPIPDATIKRIALLKRELQSLRELQSEHLARVDGLVAHAGQVYLAVEHVEGPELLAHVRRDGGCDASALARAVRDAARGLAALHAAGFVHRTLEPRQIVIMATGRALIRGFAALSRSGAQDDGRTLGDPAYAAPEQLRGAEPQPSADVYALGRCLREALGSRVDETGPDSDATDERTLRLLRDWCRRLLAEEPRDRPELEALIAALDPARERRERMQAAGLAAPTVIAPFAGREQELARLALAFERTCDDGFTLALIQGESGVGKSSLTREFARRAKRKWPALQVLEGRCYEREQSAFKAFEGAIEQLAKMLGALSNPQCEALLPPHAALLGQLFPALAHVPAIGAASKHGLPAEPAAQKLAARACLVALLAKLSESHELLFVVDDLQWADNESFALLEVLRSQQQRLPLLMLCTLRAGASIDPGVAEQLAALRASPATEVIELAGLGADDAQELAGQLAGSALSAERLALLARESEGHPLFLHALITRARRGADGEAITLEQALTEHVAGLDDDARTLLTFAALASKPLTSERYACALGRRSLPRAALDTLLEQGLLRWSGGGELTCEHDRIRQVALSLTSPERRKRLALALARALADDPNAEPAERARLLEEGDDRLAASEAYACAGDRALAGLAFGRAEQHYARAIALLRTLDRAPGMSVEEAASELDARLGRLLENRGHALVRAGRSAEAARVYESAAEQARGAARVRLRMWSAQQLMQSAQVEAGIRTARGLLEELGLTLPRSDRAALLRIAIERALMRVRRTELRPRPRGLSEQERLQLETLHGLSAPVRALEYLPGSALIAQYLRRALAAGEPLHAARALAFEAVYRSVATPLGAHDALFDRSRALADAERAPALSAEIELLQGVACLARGQFGSAPGFLSAAETLLQTRCPGEPWLLTSARMYLGSSWAFTGSFAELARHGASWLAEARERDDRYASAALSGFGCASLRHLLADEPERAHAELVADMAPWPREPFTTNQFGAFFATAHVLLYASNGNLLRWADAERVTRDRAYVMHTPLCQLADQTVTMLGIFEALRDARGDRRSALLARADDELKRLAKNPARVAAGFGTLARGVLEAVRGNPERARACFRSALAPLEEGGSSWTLGALYLDGLLEGGDGGRQKREPLLALVRAQGFKDPTRALRLRVPGLGLVSS